MWLWSQELRWALHVVEGIGAAVHKPRSALARTKSKRVSMRSSVGDNEQAAVSLGQQAMQSAQLPPPGEVEDSEDDEDEVGDEEEEVEVEVEIEQRALELRRGALQEEVKERTEQRSLERMVGLLSAEKVLPKVHRNGLYNWAVFQPGLPLKVRPSVSPPRTAALPAPDGALCVCARRAETGGRRSVGVGTIVCLPITSSARP